MSILRKWLRSERALALALFPVPYAAVYGLLIALITALELYLNSYGLLWQCMSALKLTLFVLGPLVFVCTSGASIYHSARKLRNREAVRKHVILIIVELAVIIASVLWFKWYWYKPV